MGRRRDVDIAPYPLRATCESRAAYAEDGHILREAKARNESPYIVCYKGWCE